MKKITNSILWATALLLFSVSLGLFSSGNSDKAGIILSVFWLVLAVQINKTNRYKGFAYTILILMAVTISMTFPRFFTNWGGFELKNLIVPLLQIITFGVGSTMRISDFKDIVKMPRAVFIGVASQYTIMPLVGFAIAKSFSFPPEIAAGVILVGCSPSGLASNVMAYISKANLALSVTITSIATILAPLFTPLYMKLLAGTMVPVSFMDMLWDVTKILIIPIILGMLFHYLMSAKVKNMDAWMSKLSMLGIAFIIVVITAAGRNHLVVVGFALVLAMFLHMTIGFSLGYTVARCFKLPERDCRAIALEVGMQNGGLASGIAASMGKIATLGLAAAVNGPLMNTVFSIISSFWAKFEPND